MKLISISDFVLEHFELLENVPTQEEAIRHINIVKRYAEFLKQSLKLEMFVPCDEDGNIMEEPKKTNYQVDVNTKCSGWKYLYDSNDKLIGYYDDRKWKEDFVKFKQAKEKVLFEGFEIDKNGYLVHNNDISIGRFISYQEGFNFLFRDNMKNIEDLVDFGFFINENTIK